MVNGFNASQAAIQAGYSEATARSQGQRLLTNVDVRTEIDKRCQGITADFPEIRKKVIEKLQKIAFSDLGDHLEYRTAKTVVAHDKETGEPIIDYKTLIDLKDSNDVDTATISEVQETRDGFRFKRMDSMKALELLAKYTGLDNAELEDLKVQIREIKDMIERMKNNENK
jgi:phage terminase small subunit